MTPDLNGLKAAFRAGERDKAIAEGEALSLANPDNPPLRQLCATMNIMTRNFAAALPHLDAVCRLEPGNADAQFNRGLCLRELGDIVAAAQQFALYTSKFPGHPDGWGSLAECRLRLGDFAGALAAFDMAMRLAPNDAGLHAARGDALQGLGRMDEAVTEYKTALRLAPQDDATLKKATSLQLEMDKGDEAIELCRSVLRANPQSITARLGAEWLLGQMVPLWHVPMMNEVERNQPYFDALKSVVTPESLVFEIGTGSGLLAMMAAKAGAKEVVTCEAVKLVAHTARKIVERNGLSNTVKVLAKPSYQVQVGPDLPRLADILVHEIFSSELLGEHVLPAIEDAKARLLKPGGKVLPGVASIMVALVGGEALGKELHVDQAFGFDLGAFNEIHPRKRPIHREDLPRVLLSADVEAFRFDFQSQSTFPPERKRIAFTASDTGLAWGLVQWIRFEFAPGIAFENHPSRPREVASWQQTIYRFTQPLELKKGDVVQVDAMHDRSRPWFEQAN